MITLPVTDFNQISQYFYDQIVLNLQFHQLICPSCKHSACLSIHGYYYRSIHTSNGLVCLRILRVKCSCGKTHSILLSSMVPHSRLSLKDQTLIAASRRFSEAVCNLQSLIPDLSEWTVRYIWNGFHHIWKQRLLSESISLAPLPELVRRCFNSFHRQFMQIHCGINTLFLQTT